jgi:16S rRNA (guanine1516-N2)-methyltransferase
MPSLDSQPSVAARTRATVAVVGDDALAQRFGLPVAATQTDGYDFLLVRNNASLELHDRRDAQLKPLSVDLTGLDIRPYAPGLSRRQPLARAVGKVKTVADATGGLAQDALRLALMGYHVTAIERSPAVAALVDDALQRLAADHPLGQRLQWRVGDARTLLPALSPKPETIYIDPMFPSKRRQSSAVRKELKWLRDLVGDDPDSLELFEAARRTATYRVVVKRPDHAPPLAPNPAGSIEGKLVRYDIYSTRL